MAPDDNDDDEVNEQVEEMEMQEPTSTENKDQRTDLIHINVTNEFGENQNVDNM